MPTGKVSPQVRAIGMSDSMDKPSTKTSKMIHWDTTLKKGEEMREKFELEYQKWVTQYEQEHATLVRHRETWIQGQLEAEKAHDQAQEMITQLDQEIENWNKEYASYASTHQELLKRLCVEMASLAVST